MASISHPIVISLSPHLLPTPDGSIPDQVCQEFILPPAVHTCQVAPQVMAVRPADLHLVVAGQQAVAVAVQPPPGLRADDL